jgi:UDP-N-acetylglucosamine 4,6-dehydratase/5-epimerase
MRFVITGGSGSLGNVLTPKLLARGDDVLIYSRDELKQAEMAERFPAAKFMIGDVRDRDRVSEAFAGTDFVIHAAALKRVDSVARNPSEVIKTNIQGTMNVVDASKVRKLILISTDKAVQPTNIYGASKMLAEQIVINAGQSVVRYGNVLGSRGSFTHIFKKAAHDKKPIPVTDSSCTRFIITLSQAADFVLQMVEKLKGGEIVVPKIKSVRVLDVAQCYSERVTTTQMRHGGEKIHELLIAPHEKNSVMMWDGKSFWHPGVYESNQNDFYSREEIHDLLKAEKLL